MMSSEVNDVNVKAEIEKVIRKIAEERSLSLPALKDDTEIVDELGFSSMMVAGLIANLEEEFGVDPFQDEDVMITDIRTIKHLCDVYVSCLARSR
ncbi:acyl carrier protein [Massilia sp. CCM 9210]|uniref:acyl carrier protein n=1 Tax=Massilia scottii TaxID=3057166 RepID=UPI002796C54E|nr:acyl carrier protein [Massilia sp. CCM 9210]MDQ1812383.1 acyl carrier protein [Massilia sp. CCM 9210]